MTASLGSDHGFSLVEAIAALAIAAASLAVFYSVLGTSYVAQRRVTELELTLAAARSQLDTLVADPTTAPGTTSGRYATGGYWHAVVSELPALAADNASGASIQHTSPYWIELEAFDRNRRRLVKLETAKLPGKAQ